MRTGGGEESKEQEYLEVIEELESQNKRIIQLMAQIQGLDTEMQTSNQYIKRFLTGQSFGYNDAAGGDF